MLGQSRHVEFGGVTRLPTAWIGARVQGLRRRSRIWLPLYCKRGKHRVQGAQQTTMGELFRGY